jgi:hypothetical protein
VLIVEIQPAGHELVQIVFNAGLVLRGRRHDPGGGDEAFGVDGVPVEHGAGGSYRSISRSASSTAYTTSTARTRMLRYGLRHAYPDVDRMDRPAADQLHDRVAGLLQRQRPLDQVAAVFGEGERAGVAEEVRACSR